MSTRIRELLRVHHPQPPVPPVPAAPAAAPLLAQTQATTQHSQQLQAPPQPTPMRSATSPDFVQASNQHHQQQLSGAAPVPTSALVPAAAPASPSSALSFQDMLDRSLKEVAERRLALSRRVRPPLFAALQISISSQKSRVFDRRMTLVLRVPTALHTNSAMRSWRCKLCPQL